MRPNQKTLLALGALFLVLVVALLVYLRMGPLPTLTDRDIAGSTAVTSQWLEIKPAPLLKPSGKTSLVILELEGDYSPDFQSQMLRFPDGALGMPDVQLGTRYVPVVGDVVIIERHERGKIREDLRNIVRKPGGRICEREVFKHSAME